MAQAEPPRLFRGFLVPSQSDLKKVVTRLKRELKTNSKLATRFRRDPRQVLGAMGLFEDAQNELIRETRLTARGCIFTCIKTCWCTDCCITDIVIVLKS